MRPITIDASVFVSAARPTEAASHESTVFLGWVRRSRPHLFLPTLIIAEVSAALGRSGNDPALAMQYALAIGELPGTVLVVLDKELARDAAAQASCHRLRGADAVYLATAAMFAAELVTLDKEQLERGSAIVQTLSPQDFMAALA